MSAQNPVDDPNRLAEPVSDAAEVAPGVYIVRHRPSGISGGLLPPLLLVILGAGFLVYRSTASDWQGIFALFSGSSRAAARAAVTEPPALALNDPPKPVPAEIPKPAAPAPSPALEAPKAEPPQPKEEPANPLEDIKREAEKTKEKIAELEKLKEEEKAKQDSTAPRRRNQPNDRDRMIAAQRELLRRQMAWMTEMQERQMREMADMQRRFMGRDFAGMPMPSFPGIDMGNGGFRPGPPPLTPHRGLRGAQPPPQPGNPDGKEVVRKTPEGTTRIRRFQGPNGSGGVIFEFRSNPKPADVPPPPEPGRID